MLRLHQLLRMVSTQMNHAGALLEDLNRKSNTAEPSADQLSMQLLSQDRHLGLRQWHMMEWQDPDSSPETEGRMGLEQAQQFWDQQAVSGFLEQMYDDGLGDNSD